MRTSPKLRFVDPALAAAATAASSARLMEDLGTTGQWFESQAVQHLRIFAEPPGGCVFHFRDKSGKEADVVVELDNGRWTTFRIKFGQRQIPTA